MPNLARPAAVLALAAALSGACSSNSNARAGAERAREPYTPIVVLDGSLGEWPVDAAALADADFLYLRVGPGQSLTLQSAPESVAVLLDLDNNPDTGTPVRGLGADLEVVFSPAPEMRGVAVRAHDAAGGSTDLTHADIDLAFAPTYASEWFELRLARDLSNIPALPTPGLAGSGTLRGVLQLRDAAGGVLGSSDPFSTELPPGAGARRLGDDPVPEKREGTLRVVSYNVLRGSPVTNPEPFARILQVVKPDIVLLQEWTPTQDQPTDASAIAQWFATHVEPETPWHAHAGDAWGLAIVSRYPLAPMGPDRLDLPMHSATSQPGDSFPVRFLGAVADTPHGRAAVASVHLKCCGSLNSDEDIRRMDEARAINAAVRDAAFSVTPSLLLVAGDYNLVGSRPPLDELRRGLDADGSDLDVADARVLGDRSMYTWRDEASPFSPGRLDYLVYSDATADATRAFVLDTRRLSDTALARLGLDRGDSGASDHLPVIVDFRVR